MARTIKRIYIAAPFFNEEQLTKVKEIEALIDSIDGLEYFSPRSKPVTQAMTETMTPAERERTLRDIFIKNIDEIEVCDAVVAILDDKDTGTIWELGYAYGCNNSRLFTIAIFGYMSKPGKINVMLSQCMQPFAIGLDECRQMLEAYARGEVWSAKKIEDTF